MARPRSRSSRAVDLDQARRRRHRAHLLGGGVRPPALNLRVATADDVAAIVELVESSYRGDASRAGWTTEADLLRGQRTDAAAVADAIGAPSSVVLLTVDDAGVVVACCHLERRDAAVYFGMFAVRPGLQGTGVGGELLAQAENYARDEYGGTSMEMTVIGQREELVAWYERRGYRQTGETRVFPYGDERFGIPTRDDLHFVVLTKSLAN
jgi:ribosomal protein S18 acetylase RimI-like enzyme